MCRSVARFIVLLSPRLGVPRYRGGCVALHPSFSSSLKLLLDEFPVERAVPELALKMVKECMHAAACRVKAAMLIMKATTPTENLFLAKKYYRLARAGRIPEATRNLAAAPISITWLLSIGRGPG